MNEDYVVVGDYRNNAKVPKTHHPSYEQALARGKALISDPAIASIRIYTDQFRNLHASCDRKQWDTRGEFLEYPMGTRRGNLDKFMRKIDIWGTGNPV